MQESDLRRGGVQGALCSCQFLLFVFGKGTWALCTDTNMFRISMFSWTPVGMQLEACCFQLVERRQHAFGISGKCGKVDRQKKDTAPTRSPVPPTLDAYRGPTFIRTLPGTRKRIHSKTIELLHPKA